MNDKRVRRFFRCILQKGKVVSPNDISIESKRRKSHKYSEKYYEKNPSPLFMTWFEKFIGDIYKSDKEPDDGKVKKLVKKECKQFEKDGLLIKQWDLDFLEADLSWCGRDGSPTKVHRIQSVVLSAKDSREIDAHEQKIGRSSGRV